MWALGGQIKAQQRYVAECFGISQIITMLLSHSEKLQFISLSAIIALADEHEQSQNRLYKENILTPLYRLLKQYQQLTHRVLLVLVRAFGVLCIGISLVSNLLLQNSVVELEVIDVFIRIMETTEYIDIKVSQLKKKKKRMK